MFENDGEERGEGGGFYFNLDDVQDLAGGADESDDVPIQWDIGNLI